MRSLTRRPSRLQPSDFVLVLQMTANHLTTPWLANQTSGIHNCLVMNAALVLAHSLYSGTIRKGNVIIYMLQF